MTKRSLVVWYNITAAVFSCLVNTIALHPLIALIEFAATLDPSVDKCMPSMYTLAWCRVALISRYIDVVWTPRNYSDLPFSLPALRNPPLKAVSSATFRVGVNFQNSHVQDTMHLHVFLTTGLWRTMNRRSLLTRHRVSRVSLRSRVRQPNHIVIAGDFNSCTHFNLVRTSLFTWYSVFTIEQCKIAVSSNIRLARGETAWIHMCV